MNGAVFLIHIANALPQKASHVEQREKCFPQVAFVFYPCHFSEKKPRGNLLCGPWKQLFSWLWIVVFISDCYRSPAA